MNDENAQTPRFDSADCWPIPRESRSHVAGAAAMRQDDAGSAVCQGTRCRVLRFGVSGDREAYFWNTQGGAELDLLVFVNGKRYGFEFKYADAPGITKSLVVAQQDLKLRRVFVIHPGPKSYPLNDWAEAVSLRTIRTRLANGL